MANTSTTRALLNNTYHSAGGTPRAGSSNNGSSSGGRSTVEGFTSQAALDAARARGDSRLNSNNQTVIGGATGGSTNQYDLPTTINSGNLNQTTPIKINPLIATPNYNGTIAGANASLGADATTNGAVPPIAAPTPTGNKPEDAAAQSRWQNLITSLGLAPQKQDVNADPQVIQSQRLVDQNKKVVNDLTATLNGITAKSQADQLSVTGQGRGIPEAIIGGQQAEISKEAAIQALPVSAQIAAAQGNLSLAQNHLDQVYKIKSSALDTAYTNQVNQFNAIKGYLNGEEARTLAVLDRNETRAYNDSKDFLQLQDSYAKADPSNAVAIHNTKNRDELYKIVGAPIDGTQNYSTIDISRYGRAANSIVKNFIALPQYNLTANGLPYLQRIQAADSIPGSVSDAELLDSIVKLNTGGNQVTEAQVKLITGGKSYNDAINVWENKFSNGGVLSDAQRSQLTTLANKVFDKYKADYQPIYDQATKQLKDAGIPRAFWTIPDLNTLSNGGGTGTNNTSASDIIKTSNVQVNGLTVTVPGQGSLTFPDQASLNRFKQDHGL